MPLTFQTSCACTGNWSQLDAVDAALARQAGSLVTTRPLQPLASRSRRPLTLRHEYARAMRQLCITEDHGFSPLHSSGLDICRKSIVIMGLRYANKAERGRQLCKAKIIQGKVAGRWRGREDLSWLRARGGNS